MSIPESTAWVRRSSDGKGAAVGRIKELFGAALEMEPTQRAGYLRDACGADENLRAEVESLIAAHDQSDPLSHAAWPDHLLTD